ncbi:MAG: radical SAM family heme chaperone HemW [Acidimicrobiales bacterium]
MSFGVYLHVPFCAHRCDYCAFATWTDRSHLVDAYLAACRADITRAVAAGMPPATSVFVGGGTPSLVPAGALVDVVGAIPVVPGAEITVECNPDTVTPALVDSYLSAGVNRLSFGVQSMIAHVLRALGRTHRPENVRAAVETARRAGVPTFNLDLIYGGAGETLQDWRRTLDETLALEPAHVSAFALTVEPGTPLAADRRRHPDDDDQADKYHLATEMLTAGGLHWYEISNWARPGHECRHNQLYWRQGDYLGFGCAAHSHRAGRRWWNVRTPERYIEAIASGCSPETASERLDAETAAIERLQLALRTADGIPADALPADDAAELGALVERRGDRIVLTVAGRLLANEVALRLTPPPVAAAP